MYLYSLFREAEPCLPSWDVLPSGSTTSFTIMETWCHRLLRKLLRKVAPLLDGLGGHPQRSVVPHACCALLAWTAHTFAVTQMCFSLNHVSHSPASAYLWDVCAGGAGRPTVGSPSVLCDLCRVMDVSHPGVEFDVLGRCSDRQLSSHAHPAKSSTILQCSEPEIIRNQHPCGNVDDNSGPKAWILCTSCPRACLPLLPLCVSGLISLSC